MKCYQLIRFAVTVLITSACAANLWADDFSKVEFRAVAVVDGITMLQGAGGNIGVLSGADGLLVIDDDYSALGLKLKQALNQIDDKGVRFLLNTHWHSDHSGNNQLLGTDGAIIIAHENVRRQLQSGGVVKAFGMEVPPADAAALPVITYTDKMTVHWNDKALVLEHIGPAHTDGDTVIYFYSGETLVAVQTGDLFFNGFYPFIDSSSGGSALGMVKGVAQILNNIDDSVAVIPGHGPLASRADLEQFYQFMDVVVGRIAGLKNAGKSRQQVIDSNPVGEFEAQWGDGFLPTEKWVGIVYDSL